MATRMHEGQIELEDDSVRRAVDRQFPSYSALPLRRLASDGTINAVFRLGDHLVVRVPIVEWGAADADREADILPRLRGQLPLTIPEVVEIGDESPELGLPWKWNILTWIDGERAYATHLSDPERFADSYSNFLTALRTLPTRNAPDSLAHGEARDDDDETRSMIARTRGLANDRAILRAWDAVSSAPDSNDLELAWIHADPTPGNLIVVEHRLAAVIDWSGAGVGDIAHDLIAAWWLLPKVARQRLRASIDVDEGTWQRGRARALKKAIYALPYYAQSNPGFASDALFALDRIVEDTAQHRPL